MVPAGQEFDEDEANGGAGEKEVVVPAESESDLE